MDTEILWKMLVSSFSAPLGLRSAAKDGTIAWVVQSSLITLFLLTLVGLEDLGQSPKFDSKHDPVYCIVSTKEGTSASSLIHRPQHLAGQVK